jgi:hypothetical protein
MHFWNKLSTAALMRLTILASLNLLLIRLVADLAVMFHPWFFLSIVTLNLGLYAVMVYSGSLNTKLIGMMAGGLAATVGTIAYSGMDATAFMFGGPFAQVGRLVELSINHTLEGLPSNVSQGGALRFRYNWVPVLGYLVIDLAGLAAIAVGGWLGPRVRGAAERWELWRDRASP